MKKLVIALACCLVFDPGWAAAGRGDARIATTLAPGVNPGAFLEQALSGSVVAGLFRRPFLPKLTFQIIAAIATVYGFAGTQPASLVAQTSAAKPGQGAVNQALKQLHWEDAYLTSPAAAEAAARSILEDSRLVAGSQLSARTLKDFTTAAWNFLWKIYGELERYGDPDYQPPAKAKGSLTPWYGGGTLHAKLDRFNKTRPPAAQIHWADNGLVDASGHPWTPAKGHADEAAFYEEFMRLLRERDSLRLLADALLALDRALLSQPQNRLPVDSTAANRAKAAHDKALEALEAVKQKQGIDADPVPVPGFGLAREAPQVVISRFLDTLSINWTRFASAPGKVPKWLVVTPLGPVPAGLVSTSLTYDLEGQKKSDASSGDSVSVGVDVPEKTPLQLDIVANDGSLLHSERRNVPAANPEPVPEGTTLTRLESPGPFRWQGEHRLVGSLKNPDGAGDKKYVPVRARLNLEPARSPFAPAVKPVPAPAMVLVDTSNSIHLAANDKLLKRAILRLLPYLKDPMITAFDPPDVTGRRPTYAELLRQFGPGIEPGAIVRYLSFGGNTHGWSALRIAYEQLKELVRAYPVGYPQDVVVITDGEFTEMPPAQGDAIQLAAFCAAHDIRISFIGIGLKDPDEKFEVLRPENIRDDIFSCAPCEAHKPKGGLIGVLSKVAGGWIPKLEDQLPIQYELAAATDGAWEPVTPGNIDDGIRKLIELKFQYVSAADVSPRTGTVTVVFQEVGNPSHLIEVTAPIEVSVPRGQIGGRPLADRLATFAGEAKSWFLRWWTSGRRAYHAGYEQGQYRVYAERLPSPRQLFQSAVSRAA